jgi:hypothetical protein
MDKKEALMRFGGIIFAIGGLALIILSEEFGSLDLNIADGKAAEFMLRSGFGTLLIGLLALFLFSVKTVPKELMDPLIQTEGQNLARIFEGLELKGNGIYIPPGGRLTEDRVYVPAELKPLPLPKLASEQVLVVGTTGPSMGASIIPPGKGMIDRIELDSGKKFKDENLMDLSEALERLTKGTGLIRSITARSKDDDINLEITHSRFAEVCNKAWKEDPSLHLKVGCPGCSSVLCAVSRISHSPIRIVNSEKIGKKVHYELKRW